MSKARLVYENLINPYEGEELQVADGIEALRINPKHYRWDSNTLKEFDTGDFSCSVFYTDDVVILQKPFAPGITKINYITISGDLKIISNNDDATISFKIYNGDNTFTTSPTYSEDGKYSFDIKYNFTQAESTSASVIQYYRDLLKKQKIILNLEHSNDVKEFGFLPNIFNTKFNYGYGIDDESFINGVLSILIDFEQYDGPFMDKDPAMSMGYLNINEMYVKDEDIYAKIYLKSFYSDYIGNINYSKQKGSGIIEESFLSICKYINGADGELPFYCGLSLNYDGPFYDLIQEDSNALTYETLEEKASGFSISYTILDIINDKFDTSAPISDEVKINVLKKLLNECIVINVPEYLNGTKRNFSTEIKLFNGNEMNCSYRLIFTDGAFYSTTSTLLTGKKTQLFNKKSTFTPSVIHLSLSKSKQGGVAVGDFYDEFKEADGGEFQINLPIRLKPEFLGLPVYGDVSFENEVNNWGQVINYDDVTNHGDVEIDGETNFYGVTRFNNKIILSESDYGAQLPEEGEIGQIFFLI